MTKNIKMGGYVLKELPNPVHKYVAEGMVIEMSLASAMQIDDYAILCCMANSPLFKTQLDKISFENCKKELVRVYGDISPEELHDESEAKRQLLYLVARWVLTR